MLLRNRHAEQLVDFVERRRYADWRPILVVAFRCAIATAALLHPD